ncbi:GIY-YIG nuclease family protein [Anoxybacillus ayderensis]|uniref:GIY-YIG nuclease family protein n=1 Tax=Anoxybacillus ayderensis TaxID=265546 RepID=UPI002E245DFE|nr:GIY-YIG nuclease family protein [Anoxybacillus ayderensis]
MFKKIKQLFALSETIKAKEQYLKEIEERIENKEKLIEEVIAEAKASIQNEAYEIINGAKIEADKITQHAHQELVELFQTKEQMEHNIAFLEKKLSSLKNEVAKLEKVARKHKVECLGIKNLVEKFPNTINYADIDQELGRLEEAFADGILEPIVRLNLHHQDSKLLRQEMNANNRDIRKLLKDYESRYTTKANMTIYSLMVIGLQAELQNILYTLSYTNLEKALDNAKSLINKYLTICGKGNANILPTITRFLSELEPLFLNAIQIEYKYYIQKEREKEEQRRIKEQMRQEAEEQRLLEQEKKKIEKEEEKYLNEIAKNKELLANETDNEKILALQAKLKELEEQIKNLEEQKEEIVKRANGRAGYVYVISNLGSFGENMFKIGMTRRLNPYERIDELGDASVPFKFDIHAMIFSENAVDLEQRLHQILNKKRVNKVNLRKEFFYSTVEELQAIVQDIDPAAEFTTTMKALEYRQSQSIRDEEIQIQSA